MIITYDRVPDIFGPFFSDAMKNKQVAVRPVCPKCGFKIRGPNHESGHHHKGKRDPKN